MWRIERFSKDYPIKPEKLIVDVRNVLNENNLVVLDVGAHKLWIAKVYNTYSKYMPYYKWILFNGVCTFWRYSCTTCEAKLMILILEFKFCVSYNRFKIWLICLRYAGQLQWFRSAPNRIFAWLIMRYPTVKYYHK